MKMDKFFWSGGHDVPDVLCWYGFFSGSNQATHNPHHGRRWYAVVGLYKSSSFNFFKWEICHPVQHNCSWMEWFVVPPRLALALASPGLIGTGRCTTNKSSCLQSVRPFALCLPHRLFALQNFAELSGIRMPESHWNLYDWIFFTYLLYDILIYLLFEKKLY